MYETPKIEKFGSFRELTLQSPPGGKTVVGTDIAIGAGMCNPNPDFPGGPNGCVRS